MKYFNMSKWTNAIFVFDRNFAVKPAIFNRSSNKKYIFWILRCADVNESFPIKYVYLFSRFPSIWVFAKKQIQSRKIRGKQLWFIKCIILSEHLRYNFMTFVCIENRKYEYVDLMLTDLSKIHWLKHDHTQNWHSCISSKLSDHLNSLSQILHMIVWVDIWGRWLDFQRNHTFVDLMCVRQLCLSLFIDNTIPKQLIVPW